MTALRSVGQSIARSDGVGHVTGRTQYAADLTFPSMLHLKVVRSPVHHARIKSVDLTEAEAVPGFVRALTHRDVPHNVYTILTLIGVEPEEEFVLAVDRVRYLGEPIIAILAETESAAIEAVSRVRLDLEELPAVFDVEEALKPDAPIVTHWGDNTFKYEGHDCRRVRFGDVEQGFAEADLIVEARYDSRPIEHAADRDHGLRREARAGRPDHGLHQHPGAVLQPRQHLDHPPDAGQPAPLRGRHRRAAGSAARSTSSSSRSPPWARSSPTAR